MKAAGVELSDPSMGPDVSRWGDADLEHRLGEVWPEVERRLRGFLCKRGATTHDAEDLIQTVAERALRTKVPFDGAEDLLHWCLTVARNLDVDRRRVQGRHGESGMDQLPEPADEISLEGRVVTRIRLARTVDALKSMRPKDRLVIIRGVEADEAASGKDRVARHRARQRLLELVGPPAVVVVGIWRGLSRPFTQPGAAALGAATAAFAVLAVIGIGAADRPAFGAGPRVQPAVLESGQPSTKDGGSESIGWRRSLNGPGRRAVGAAPAPTIAEHTILKSDPNGTVRLNGHDRRPQDAGLVCARNLPVLPDTCLGPSSLPPVGPGPALDSSRAADPTALEAPTASAATTTG